MPRQRFYNLAPRAQKKLLGVATKHFAHDGFERASLNAILVDAGFSKGSFYYYFDDKDDLFATALESAFDGVITKLPMPALDELTVDEFWPTVEKFVWKWASVFDESGDLVRAAFQLTEAQRKSARFAPLLAKGQVIYRALIEPGQRLGCIRADLPVETLVALLEANDVALDAIFVRTHDTVTHESLANHVRLVFDTFKRLLVADPFGKAKRARRRDG